MVAYVALCADTTGAWRSYLPEACVSCMIDDGWQWSTEERYDGV